MTATVRQRAVFLALALVMILAWGIGPAMAGIYPAMPKAAKAPPAANVQEPTDPAQVDAFMATLTDTQARQLLHDKLAAKAKVSEGEGSGQSSGLIQDIFERLESNIRTIQARNAAFLHEAGQELGQHRILANLSDGGGAPVLLRYLLVLAAIMAGGGGRLSCGPAGCARASSGVWTRPAPGRVLAGGWPSSPTSGCNCWRWRPFSWSLPCSIWSWSRPRARCANWACCASSA